MWWLWLIIALVSFLIEILTPSALVSIWFCPGALCAALVSLVTKQLWLQGTVFIVVSLAAMLLVRPILKNMLFKAPEPTNHDRYIGQRAVLAKAITAAGPGEIKLDGIEWRAISHNGLDIPAGTEVEITAIQGVKMVVRKVYQV